MLLGNSTEKNAGYEIDDGFISEMIRDRRYAEAYTALVITQRETVSNLFNIALCCIHIGKHAEALHKLDKAILQIDNRPLTACINPDRTLSELDVLQTQYDTHLSPISEKYVSVFPERVRESLLRLKIDCHAELGQKSKVIQTAALLRNKKFANIETAFSKIK